MRREKTSIFHITLLAIGLSSLLMVSCKNKSAKGMIILTEVEGNLPDVNYVTGDFWRYIPQSRIVALNPDKHAEIPKILTEGYYSASSPDISYDGRHMLFAAQLKQGDPWYIYEMNLDNLTNRKVSLVKESSTDPAYLPGGRVVFSKIAGKNTTGVGHALFTCNLDGSDIRQIAFHPHADFASTVLSDGRILTISRQLYPAAGEPMLFVMRPDGTKGDLFYKGAGGTTLRSRAWENKEGNVFFVESNLHDSAEGSIICINQDRPLHTRVNLTAAIKGDFHAIFPLPSGKLLVSYRSQDNERYALYEFDTKTSQLARLVFADPKYNILEGVLAEAHNRPRKLPSEVDPGVKTGLLLCQDINFPDIQSIHSPSSQKKASKIEVLGLNSSLGIVKVEEDGSFYLKAMANTPFRLQALDENDKIINGPCAWIWLQPNERRGCIGCHEDHELAPENKVPLAVKKAPVIIPRHIKKVGEKEVELE